MLTLCVTWLHINISVKIKRCHIQTWAQFGFWIQADSNSRQARGNNNTQSLFSAILWALSKQFSVSSKTGCCSLDEVMHLGLQTVMSLCLSKISTMSLFKMVNLTFQVLQSFHPVCSRE